MSQTKQLPLFSKPDAYAGLYSGPTTNQLAANIPLHYNGYFEVNSEAGTDSRKMSFNKRPGIMDANGISLSKTNFITANAGEKVTGLTTSLDKTVLIYSSQDATKRYSNIYTYATNTRSQTDITASFSTGEYAFTQLDGINFGANVFYAANNGTDGAVINAAGTWTKITDVDFTGNGVKTNFVGLDGYLFYGVISGTNAGRIYNSTLNDATAWNSLSFIQAYDIPGAIVWLSRLRNYIVCFKQYSIEFFEDVGVPPPASPLEARKGLTKHIGCASASSVQIVSDGIIFLGINKSGKQSIYKISATDMSIKSISDATIDYNLQAPNISLGNFQTFSNDPLNVSSVARGQSQVIIWGNKELYNIVVYNSFTNAPVTMTYDNELDFWSCWASNFQGADGLSDSYWTPSMCFLINTSAGYLTCFVNNASTTKAHFCAFNSTAGVTFTDEKDGGDGKTYQLIWVSDMYDFGTNDRKFLNALEVIYDCNKNLGGGSWPTVTASLNLFLHRNNLNTGNAIPIPRDINNTGFNRANYQRLGNFRRASFVLYSDISAPLRIWAVEAVYSGGPQYG